MSIKLRQVCLVAHKLAPILEDLKAVFDLDVCFIDKEVAVFGLENALVPIGTGFIEVVAPVKEGTAAGRYLERRGGDGGYMVITQAATEEIQTQARARAEALGVRVAWEHAHEHGKFMQLHPADVGGSFFEIDSVTETTTPNYWPPAGGTGWEDKVNDAVVTDILGVELQCDAPEELAKRWGEIAGKPIAPSGEGEFHLDFDNASIRFVRTSDHRGPGLSAISLKCSNKSRALAAAEARGLKVSESEILLCGTRFKLTGS